MTSSSPTGERAFFILRFLQREQLNGRCMGLRSETGPCPENQIRFNLDHFTFRRNVWLDHLQWRKEIRHTCKMSFQSCPIEFRADPSSGRQPLGLQFAYVETGDATEGVELHSL